MTARQRLCHRALWLLLSPPLVAVLMLAARLPVEPPASVPWPTVLPAENV